MAKRIDIDGKSFRMRRGVLVEIPEKWIDQTVTPQAKRKRQSKTTRKEKNNGWKNNNRELGGGANLFLRYKRGEDVFNEVREVEI